MKNIVQIEADELVDFGVKITYVPQTTAAFLHRHKMQEMMRRAMNRAMRMLYVTIPAVGPYSDDPTLAWHEQSHRIFKVNLETGSRESVSATQPIDREKFRFEVEVGARVLYDAGPVEDHVLDAGAQTTQAAFLSEFSLERGDLSPLMRPVPGTERKVTASGRRTFVVGNTPVQRPLDWMRVEPGTAEKLREGVEQIRREFEICDGDGRTTPPSLPVVTVMVLADRMARSVDRVNGLGVFPIKEGSGE